MFAAFNIGMGEFVNQYHRRFARKNGVHVHLFEDCPLVFDLASRNGIQSGCQLCDWFAPMRLDDADGYVFAPTVATDGLTQHVVSLSHARRISQKEFEHAFFLLRHRLFQPLLGSPTHAGYCR